MNAPDPQRHAADPAASAWVEASAGTGKTHVLTSRVLRLLLAGAPAENILCLTFTRAAAAEMANRVHGRLAQWATAPEATLAEDLAALTGREPDEATLAAARRLFAAVLDAAGGLRIETIHAFAESLLKRFPLEAGLAPHFRLMDDRDAAERLGRAMDAVLRADAAVAEPLLPALVALTDEQRFADLLLALARERGRFTPWAGRPEGIAAAVPHLRQRLGLAAGETEAAVLAAAAADGAFDMPGLRACLAALLNGSARDREKGECIARWLADPTGRAAGFADYCTAFLRKDGEPLKTLITRAAAKTLPEAADILAAEADRLRRVLAKLAACRLAETNAVLLRLAERMIREYETEKRRHALLDYDDLILAARDLLERPGIAPWVLYKLDGRLDHVLIDEAQDTNPEQWRVVAALAAEFFAGAGARQVQRTVFAVGDPKQSIYSFQRADPREFQRMRGHFADAVAAAGADWRAVELTLSFRSTPPVLELVDRVFADEAARDGLLLRPDVAVRHVPSRAGDGGLVELWPLEEPAEQAEEEPWALPVAQGRLDDPVARLADRIAQTIRGWLDRGEPLVAKGRPVHAGDVLILVQRRVPFLETMVRALKRHGVPVAGADRMVLTQQIAVMDLMALGRFLLLPQDDLTLATVLKGPFCGLDDDDLFRLCHGRAGRLWPVLQARAGETPSWRRAADRLAGWLGRADLLTPHAFYARLLGEEGGRRELLGRLGPDAADPIEEFLNLALDYERERPPSLQGFLAWLEAGAVEIKRDQEERGDAVRVMTVHGAKGLQAPIVFLPDTTRAPPQRKPPLYWLEGEPALPLWCPRADMAEAVAARAAEAAKTADRQESRRLLYVALTRAADRLYVAGWRRKQQPPEDCWYRLVERAMAGLAEDAADAAGRPLRRRTAPQLRRIEATSAAAGAEPEAALPAWAWTAAPEEPRPSRPLAPSRPEEEEPPPLRPLADAGRQRWQRGLLVHRLLQSLPDLPAAERPDAARRYLAMPAHGLPAEAQAALAAETLAVLEDPAFAPLFGPASIAEAPLSGTLDGRVVAGRLDRLAVLDERVLLVDYKTNRPAPVRLEDVPAAYLRQMAIYARLLAAAFPGRRVEAALLWTEGPRLLALPGDALDAALGPPS